jgi:hypothetical protein
MAVVVSIASMSLPRKLRRARAMKAIDRKTGARRGFSGALRGTMCGILPKDGKSGPLPTIGLAEIERESGLGQR